MTGRENGKLAYLLCHSPCTQGLQGVREIGDRLFTGGLSDAVSLVKAGLAAPTDFRLMLGVSGWGPGQLSAEVGAGLWHPVAASSGLVLPKRAPPPKAAAPHTHGRLSAGTSHGAAGGGSCSAHGRVSVDMWERIMSIVKGPQSLPPWMTM